MTKKTRRHHHQGAYAVVTARDAIAVVRKQRGPYLGSWDLPGGRLRSGESPLEALSREVREETGLRVCSSQLLSSTKIRCCHQLQAPEPEELHHVAFIYKAYVVGEAPLEVRVEQEDVSEARWLSLDDIHRIRLSPVVQAALRSLPVSANTVA